MPKPRPHAFVGALVVCAIIVLAACGRSAGSPGSSARDSSTPPPGVTTTLPDLTPSNGVVTVRNALLANGYTRPSDLCESAVILNAQVSGYYPGHWNTVDGRKPAPSVVPVGESLDRDGYQIWTPLWLTNVVVVRDVHLGPPTREYAMIGGRDGMDTYSLSPFPMPVLGHYLLVFLPSSAGGPVNGPAGLPLPGIQTLMAALPIDSNNFVHLPSSAVLYNTLATQIAACS